MKTPENFFLQRKNTKRHENFNGLVALTDELACEFAVWPVDSPADQPVRMYEKTFLRGKAKV